MARVAVGTKLCRNPEWIDAVISYIQNIAKAAIILKLVPRVMRPPVGILTLFVYRIHLFRRRVRLPRLSKNALYQRETSRQNGRQE